MKPVLLALAAASLSGAATAAPGGAPEAAPEAALGSLPRADCFSSDLILNHTVGDGHTLYLNVDRRAVYRVTMSNQCLTATGSTATLGVRQAGGSRVCRPADLELSTGGGRCVVASIVKLSKQEAAALPRSQRP